MGVYIRVEPTPITTAGIYHNSDLGLISLSSDGTNWITIADKNLGATQVRNDGDTLNANNVGNFYQRGNNYGFQFNSTITTSSTGVNTTGYGPGNYYSSSTFVTYNGTYARSTVSCRNLRGGVTGTNEAMQGPCPSGFHIPSYTDWTYYIIGIFTAFGLWSNAQAELCAKYIKLPPAGMINGAGTFTLTGERGIYTSASEYADNQNREFGFGGSTHTSYRNKVCGGNIRPFANTPTQPDTGRTVLYQPN